MKPSKATALPSRLAAFLSLMPATMLGACNPPTDPVADQPDVMVAQAVPKPVASSLIAQGEAERAKDNCLLVVWQTQDEPDTAFDEANDATDGGAISCATGTSASEFERTIGAVRKAALAQDRDAMLAQVGVPLLYIDANGERREITQDDLAGDLFADVFDEQVLAALERLDLKRMTVAQDQGGFFDLGALWLVVKEPGGTPRIATINRQALAEAQASLDE